MPQAASRELPPKLPDPLILGHPAVGSGNEHRVAVLTGAKLHLRILLELDISITRASAISMSVRSQSHPPKPVSLSSLSVLRDSSPVVVLQTRSLPLYDPTLDSLLHIPSAPFLFAVHMV